MKKIYMPSKKKTILLVDDDPVVVHIYQDKLQRQGFKVEVANDGKCALRTLKLNGADLVILDLCLPGIDGIEVLKNIRTEFEAQALPVIVFSNSYLGNQMRAAETAGATRCLFKAESTPAQLSSLVHELLGKTDANTSDQRIATIIADGTPAIELETELAATILDQASEGIARLRSGYLAIGRTDREDLRQSQLLEMHQCVHSLTGPTALVGLRKIAQLATALEALLIELHVKPKKITPSVLRTLGQAIDVLASLSNEKMTSESVVAGPPRILVVDDETISRETICSALGRASLTTVALDDSLAAERLLEREPFDLIFLDVEMPGRSGLELCVNIREMPVNRVTPVVFVTAHSDFETRAQSVLSGGNDFILKPFLMVELAVKALTWLFHKNAKASATLSPQRDSGAKEARNEAPLATSQAASTVQA